jgi:hypothetical protein
VTSRERELLALYQAVWPPQVARQPDPGDRSLVLEIEGFEAFPVRTLAAAPLIGRALDAVLPVRGHLIHSAWSGSGVRALEAVALPGVTAHENSTFFPAPGDVCYTVGHDELTMFYGDALPAMPSGRVRESVFAVVGARFREFQEACMLTRLTGARPFVLRAA